MTGTIIFNGTSSQDFGLVVEKLPPSVHALRRGNIIQIPGRNGVIVHEDGSFDTYTQKYEIWFSDPETDSGRSAYDTARDIAVWLLGASGFCRLEDDFEPEYYRLARYSGAFDVDMSLLQCGKAVLSFDVQPQRYLKSGETPLTFEGGATSTINNPTQFEARPLLKFTDTSTTPDYVTQTLTMNDNRYIDSGGNIIGAPYGSTWYGNKVSAAVNCSGKANARITGNGYAFKDSNGVTRSSGFRASNAQRTFVGLVVAVPSWASTIIVSRARTGPANLALQDPRPNPGASAVTINGIVINLDFSEHDVIFLDCDLHDAYYADGSNANKMVSFRSSVVDYPTFPGLSPGENSVIPNDGAILDFELTPRWWTL